MCEVFVLAVEGKVVGFVSEQIFDAAERLKNSVDFGKHCNKPRGHLLSSLNVTLIQRIHIHGIENPDRVFKLINIAAAVWEMLKTELVQMGQKRPVYQAQAVYDKADDSAFDVYSGVLVMAQDNIRWDTMREAGYKLAA